MQTTTGKESLVRMAHYVPFDNLDLSTSTKNDLVLNVLFIENTALTLPDIQKKIRVSLGCEIDMITLNQLIIGLVKDELITQSKDSFVLSYSCYTSMKTKVSGAREFKEQVLNEWIYEKIIPHYGELGSDELGNLKEKLTEFLTTLFLSHGAASKELIERGTSNTDFLTTTNELIGKLTYLNQMVDDIAKIEFPLFLGSTNANIKRYLEHLVETAFRYLTTICDPDVIQNIKDTINGKVLYLDSSTVYRLLNLQGEHRYLITKEVINLSREFGFKLKVTALTLKELGRRISFDSRVLLEFPTPVNLSAVGYKYMTEENFVSTYWLTAKKQGVEIKDFIAKYKSIDLVLEEEGIEVEKELPVHSEDFNKEWIELIGKINQRTDHDKSASASEHDAYLIALMTELREPYVINRFLESPAWILTTDHFFLRFQKNEYQYKDSVPFALLPTQLIQILRFAKPSENKFNEMFLNAFSKTFIPMSDGLSNAHTQKILSRISQYKGSTTLLAEKVLSDQYFRNRYKQSESDGEQEEIIHETLIEKASELEAQVLEKENKLKHMESKINEFVEKQERLLEVISDKESVLTTVSTELENSKKETGIALGEMQSLQQQLQGSNETIESLKGQVDVLLKKDKRRDRINKIILRIIFSFLYIVISSYLIYFLFPVTTKIIKCILLTIITVLVWPLSYYLFNNKKVATLISTIISIVATIFGLYYTVL